ncbi:MAG: cyclic nucleotide-binding domain-containing protein [Thermoanaerobaculia bacterium]
MSVSEPPDVKELVALARRFAERKLYDEAAELFGVALRLEPRNLGTRLALARVRRMQKALGRLATAKDPVENARSEMRRNGIDASHFVGLAWLYAEKGEEFRALECLHIARLKDPLSPANFKLAARIHFRLQDYDSAAELLQRALRYNPFDREAAELLGQIEYERKQFAEALAATIDAFLLLPSVDEERAIRLRRRIRTLKHLLSWQSKQVVALFREREEQLHTAFDRLEWRRERFRSEETWESLALAALVAPQDDGGRLKIAGRLRKLAAWAHFTDEQIFKLSAAVEEKSFEAGALIFANNSEGVDICLLEEGEISIQRPTPYGTYPLALLQPGSMFGEVNFLTRGVRTGDAMALKPCRLLVFDGGKLEELSRSWSEFGVQLYWGLWHSLAGKLRSTNEQLKTFFSADKQPENFLRLRRGRDAGGTVEVPPDDKVRLFQEQGLSSKELTTLATFSKELRFESGAALFAEGDEGHEMYVVLEGKVLISKYIPGAGEEALAILERGDFFGEMSLIDGDPRSADARAHGGVLTVLALDQATIQEMLVLDPQASLDFLKLLCRLVAKRLREIDEKVIGWRIMSGERTPEMSAGRA